MNRSLGRLIALAFIAGFLGVLVFHQGFLLVAYLSGWLPRAPYDLSATPPLGVPKVISLAFWGGVWGIVMVLALHRIGTGRRLALAFLFGGLVPTLVGTLIVAPLKGQPVLLLPGRLALGFIINGIWGLGAMICYTLLARRPAAGKLPPNQRAEPAA
jgi:hypothetical protein